MYALCRALKRECHVVIGSMYDPTDFSGYPAPDFQKGVVRMLPNDSIWADLKDGDVVYLDELSTLEGRQQAVMLRPVLENRVGNFKLPNVSWVASANPPEMAAGGGDLTPPLANRLGHLEWTVDSKSWAQGMIAGFPDPKVTVLPPGWQELFSAQAAVVAAYMQVQSHKLFVYPKNPADAGRAWPSPRTWYMATMMLTACEAAGEDHDTMAVALGAYVGSGAALEFLAWRRELDLPDPEDLLRKPDDFKLPKRMDQRYATLASVVAAIIRHPNDQRNLAGWRIFALAAKQGAPDVAAAAVRPRGALLKERGTELKLSPPPKIKDLDSFVPVLEKWVWKSEK
jgi:hypothetical protein